MLLRKLRTTFKKSVSGEKDFVLNVGLRKVAFRTTRRQKGFPGIHSERNSPLSMGLGDWESVMIYLAKMTMMIMRMATVYLALTGYWAPGSGADSTACCLNPHLAPFLRRSLECPVWTGLSGNRF